MSTDLSVDGPSVEVLGGPGEPEEAPAPRGVERLPVRGDGEPPPAPALALAPSSHCWFSCILASSCSLYICKKNVLVL